MLFDFSISRDYNTYILFFERLTLKLNSYVARLLQQSE